MSTPLSNQPVRAVPKPTYKRRKPTAKQRGDISPEVSNKVKERSGNACERCGWYVGKYDPTGKKMGLQHAHLIKRNDIQGQTEEWDIARLCGPSVNSGTCHHWVDSTREGREWAREFRLYLLKQMEE